MNQIDMPAEVAKNAEKLSVFFRDFRGHLSVLLLTILFAFGQNQSLVFQFRKVPKIYQ